MSVQTLGAACHQDDPQQHRHHAITSPASAAPSPRSPAATHSASSRCVSPIPTPSLQAVMAPQTGGGGGGGDTAATLAEEADGNPLAAPASPAGAPEDQVGLLAAEAPPGVSDGVAGSGASQQAPEKASILAYFKEHPDQRWAAVALLLSFGLAYVNVTACVPFLSDSLKQAGIGEIAIGFVFALHSFGMVAATLITGRVERSQGNSRMMVFGFLLAGCTTVATAFALDISGGSEQALLWSLLLLRFAAGFGEGLADTAIMNYYQTLFPEVLGQILGLSEGMVGLGYALGPLIGGLLYDAAGWRLPFLVVACPFFALAVVVPRLVGPVERQAILDSAQAPPAADQPSDVEEGGDAEANSASPRRCPAISYCVAAGIAVNGLAYGSTGPVLGQHLSDFYSMSKSAAGVVFGASGVIYWTTGLFIGNACDNASHRGDYTGYHFLHGFVVMVVGYVLLGPVPLPESVDSALHLDNHTVQLVVLLVGFTIGTVSMAFSLIGGMAVLTLRARDTSQASALFNGSINVGYGLGPILMSAVVSVSDYRTAMASCALLGAVYYCVALVLMRGVFDMSR